MLRRATGFPVASGRTELAVEDALPQQGPAEAAQHVAVDERRLGRSVLQLAWPLIAERASLSLLAAINGIFVGRYVGDDGLAAVGLAVLLLWLPETGVIGLETGTTTVVSWDYGRGDRTRLAATVRSSIALAVTWGLGMAATIIAIAYPAMRLMGVDEDVVREGVAYMRPAAIGLVGLSVFAACAGAFRGVGNSRFPMVVMLTANVVNAIVTWLLISGAIGIELGTAAGGWAFATSGMSAGTMALIEVLRRRGGLDIALGKPWQVSRFAARRVLDMSVPVGLEELQFQLAFLVYVRIIASIGTEATAAHTVALRTTDMAIVAVFGLGTAATALVGQAMGAGRPALAERISKLAQRYAVGAMLVLAACQFIFAPQVAGLFTNDAEVIDEAVKALRVFALGVPALGLYATVSGSLRGAGDVRFVLLILTVTAWGVRIPGAFLGAHVLGLGLAGAWLGAVVEVNTRAFLNVLRFRTGRWKERQV
ncbi:MAG: MATE family efflux transporter [Dehalococcoidia bacterium]|nr:MATE family efflux transporter [Dehalococcoidia bacterium]